jgi:hypothetical protein
MITALSKSQNNYLPLLPSGSLKQEVLYETIVKKNSKQQNIKLVMQVGIGLKPDFFWATVGKNPKFFAFISPGYSIYLKEWESFISGLQKEQNSIIEHILEKRANNIQHAIDGLLMIKNVSIFDSIKGEVTSPRNVYVLHGRIHKIADTSESTLQPMQVIDGSEQILLPGLFDMHAHANGWSGAYHLANGVTTVRDMGNQNKLIKEMIGQIGEGKLLSPSIIPAGLIEGKSEFSNSDGILIATLEEARNAVDFYFQSQVTY